MKAVSVIFIGFCLMIGCAACEGAPTGPGIAKIDTGYISGINETGVWAYLGIPYAAPPVGDLRWSPPEAAKPWNGIRQAKAFGPACLQIETSKINEPKNMSEDCLYLNVWTPAKSPDEKMPVMVYIHGGAFLRGASSQQITNGSALARKGVVVVSLNYRLGVLGFLVHPDLSKESPYNTSGNYGFLDQEAALKWVQDNIAAFGGDPSRVTIFGESAGAMSVLVHLASPQSRGLYSQAIVQSGLIRTRGLTLKFFNTRAEAERRGLDYARSLGCSGPDAIHHMRNISALDLINGTPGVRDFSFWGNYDIYFKPTIDGWLIPDAPEEIFRNRQESPVPLIIGTSANEGTVLVSNANMTVEEYETYIREHFGEDASTVLAKYQAHSPDEIELQLGRIMTYFDFEDAARLVAGSMASLNSSTYLYRFTYPMPGQPYGAYHGSELYFIFRTAMPEPDPASLSVSDNMMDLWTRFAKAGDPNGGMNVTWQKYSIENGQYLDIGAIPMAKTGY